MQKKQTQKKKKVFRFGIQRKIVSAMTSESWRSVPHVSFVYEPDVTDFYQAFKRFNDETPYNITFNTVLLKAIAEGIKANPAMNAHIRYEKQLVRGKLTYFDNIDISVPWTLPDGKMMTITMKDVGNRTLKNMAEYTDDINRRLKKTNLTEALYSVSLHDTLDRLTSRHFFSALIRLYGSKSNPRHKVEPLKGEAKRRYDAIPDTEKIVYEDLKQGTITVSNIGAASKGVRGYLDMLMIIPPQICAIGVSAMQKRPVVVEEENGDKHVEIRTLMPMCICFDHRALDFSELKPFLYRMEEIFKEPSIIMNDSEK